MSEEFDAEENESEGEGIKNLRKQFEAQKKELAELRALREQIDREKRQSSVAEVLKAKGIPAGAAKFYDGDDTSEDAVGKWLEANADVFQVKSTEQAAPEAAAQDANTLAAMRIAQESFGATPADAGGQTVDADEKARLMRTLSTEELVKLKWIPDPRSLVR